MRSRLNLAGVLAVAGVITYYSVRPLPTAQYGGVSMSTLWYHAVAYFALAAALLVYFHDTPKGHIEAVVAATVFGAGLELVQWQLPGRVFAVTDITVNWLGASLVLLDHQSKAVTRIVAAEDRIIEEYVYPVTSS